MDETIKPEIFTNLLRYIYTNDEEVIREDNAIDLLRAADRFMVDDLKQTIEDYVENSIDQENVLWLLEVADRFGVPRLKRACVDYVCTQEMKAKVSQSYFSISIDSSLLLSCLLEERIDGGKGNDQMYKGIR